MPIFTDWDERYRQGDTGWDMGEVSPPLAAYFSQLPDKTISILVPGCGNSYEAAWLLDNGFSSLTLIDLAAVLMARLREKFRKYPDPPLRLVTGDFFALEGQYDLIVEQTFFCALDPVLRPAYVEKMAALLRPGGRLAGLLFDRAFPIGRPDLAAGEAPGPPFGGNKEEYVSLLEKKFRIRTLEPCYNSIKPRAGTELFLIAERLPC